MELYNDDCLKILPTLGESYIDMVLVDLPYGQTDCTWDVCIDLEKMWKQLKRIGKENTAFVFFTTSKFGYKLIQSNEKWFRYDLVWQKTQSVGFLNANKMPLRNHEMIYVFYKKLPTYNPQKTFGKPYTIIHRKPTELYGNRPREETINKGDRYPVSIQKFNPPAKSQHQTQKPTDLCEWLIKTYSNEGDTILDFTMGSGTTGVACKNLNRKFIGIEMDEAYFKICEERLK
jgi:DNA modification methylase